MRRVLRATLLASLAFLATPPAFGALVAQDRTLPDTVAVDSLVVTATPVPLPPGSLGSHVTVLRGDELRARGIATVTAALRERAGMTIVRNGSYGAFTSLFLRGGESDYVQVMVDGVAINQPGGAVDLAGLTTEAVERIEVVRGPASALNGSDAVAGVVNVITRRGTEDGSPVGTLTLGGGTFDRLDGTFEVRGGDERARYGVSLSRYSTDGILELNNEHRNTVLTGSADFSLSERSEVRITTRLADRKYNFPTDGSGNVVDENQNTFSQEATVGVRVGHRLGDPAGGPGTVDLTADVALHDVETGTDDAPDGPADTLGFYGFQSLDAFRRTAADLRATWRATGALTLAGGAELENQKVRTFNESLSQFGPTTSRSENERSNRAGYLHAVAEAGPLTARAGARVEDNEQYGDFTTWQVGASWQVVPGTRLRGAAGRGIKEPTFFEAFATGFARGNPELEPERSRSWEVGVEQSLFGVARAEVTWFDQRFRDLIQYTFSPPEPTDPNYFNIAEADARGLELVLKGQVRDVALAAEWTRLDTEVVDAGFQTGEGATFVEGEPLLRRPENQLRLSAAGPAGGRVRWHAALGWVGERADRDFSSFPAAPVTLESYTTVDAGVEATVLDGSGPGVDLLLRGTNLTDAEYAEVFGFRAPGRAFFVGARVRVGGGR